MQLVDGDSQRYSLTLRDPGCDRINITLTHVAIRILYSTLPLTCSAGPQINHMGPSTQGKSSVERLDTHISRHTEQSDYQQV